MPRLSALHVVRRALRAALCAAIVGILGAAAHAQPAPTAAPFHAGDRVCFLGDSIFHGGEAESDVLLFYATRFPHTPIAFRNCGVGGDTAERALNRLDWDVKPYRPTVTVLMLGMNDIGRWLYGSDKDSAAVRAQRQKLLDTHIKSMAGIVSQLQAMHSRVIICTPSPYDQTTRTDAENALGADDALAAAAANARTLAKDTGSGLVRFHDPMDQILAREQAKKPDFTMMHSARIHPDARGNLVMAYLLLRDQGMSPTVARMSIDAAAAKVDTADNCTLTHLQKSAGGLSFDYLANALPFPISDEQAPVLNWVPLMSDLNQETLTVTGLPAGQYAIVIDDHTVATASAADLARGVNLAAIHDTPEYQQAAAVAELVEKRRNRENSTLRAIAALEHDVLRPEHVDLTDMDAVKKAMDAAIAREGKNNSWRYPYFKNLSREYYTAKPQQEKITAELAETTKQIFKAAEPTTHHITIRPAPAR